MQNSTSTCANTASDGPPVYPLRRSASSPACTAGWASVIDRIVATGVMVRGPRRDARNPVGTPSGDCAALRHRVLSKVRTREQLAVKFQCFVDRRLASQVATGRFIVIAENVLTSECQRR